MIERKSLTWFLIIAFALSWPLFLSPLFLGKTDSTQNQLTPPWLIQGLWAAAMWGPGIAAIITTVFIAKEPFKNLRLNTLGPKHFYLWAWLLPIALTIVGGLFTLLFGMAKLDFNFTMFREALALASGGPNIPAGWIVAIQVLLAFTLAPFFNTIFALGEELGWRGFLFPKLLPLGKWKAILISNIIWGIWHAPAIAQGLNYPGYPVAGIFMMIIFTILLGTIFSWLYLNTRSPWAAALAHGSVNAVAGLPVLFFKPGFNMALGGTIAAPASWLGLGIFVLWLIWTKRLTASTQPGEAATGLRSGRKVEGN